VAHKFYCCLSATATAADMCSVVSTRDAILIVVVVWNNSKEIGKGSSHLFLIVPSFCFCSIKAAKVFLQGHGYEVVVPNPTVTGELILASIVAAATANDMVN
jgi:hypothetical protein